MRTFTFVAGVVLACYGTAAFITEPSWGAGFAGAFGIGLVALAYQSEPEIERDASIQPAPDYDKGLFARSVKLANEMSTEGLHALHQRVMESGDYRPEVMDAMLHVLGDRQAAEIRTEEAGR